jgi:hypothetical protein
VTLGAELLEEMEMTPALEMMDLVVQILMIGV